LRLCRIVPGARFGKQKGDKVDTDSLRAQLHTSNWRISDCQANVNNMSAEIDVLQAELAALDSDMEGFDWAIRTQRQCYDSLTGFKGKQRLHDKLEPALHDVLIGDAYVRAAMQLCAVREEIQLEIRAKALQLETAQYQLRILNNSHQSLLSQLSQAAG
jgi:hypothetical protein